MSAGDSGGPEALVYQLCQKLTGLKGGKLRASTYFWTNFKQVLT